MWAMIKNIPFFKSRPLVSVVRLSGVIATGDGGGRLNDAGLAPMLERAFRKGKPAAVALIVNSPGGSPVQSSLIAARIRRLSSETKTPVHCFVEDVAASGGYWLATAADQIWVDDSSIVGSIGVISAGGNLRDKAFVDLFLQRFQPHNVIGIFWLERIQHAFGLPGGVNAPLDPMP
jgi:ClpP class serine protease